VRYAPAANRTVILLPSDQVDPENSDLECDEYNLVQWLQSQDAINSEVLRTDIGRDTHWALKITKKHSDAQILGQLSLVRFCSDAPPYRMYRQQ
jgi:hypothetical protein